MVVPLVKRIKGILTETITEFLFQYSSIGYDLPTVELMKSNVYFRFISSSFDGDRVSLCLEINDNTRIDDVRKCWYIVDQWRQRLIDWQGPPIAVDASFYVWLSELKKNNSYGEIAAMVNRNIATCLTEYVTQKHLAALAHADDFLRLSRPRLTNEEREGILETGIREIKEGRQPFIGPENPVTSQEIRDRITYWRRQGVEKTG